MCKGGLTKHPIRNETTEPTKILHLIPTLSSGGAERQLVNLVSSTSQEIVHHVVCVMGEADFFASAIRQAGGRLIELNISGKHPFFKAARKFRQIIRKEKPDIVQSWLYDANIAARLARLPKNSVPLVTSLQSSDYSPEAGKAGNWNPKKVLILRWIDKITAVLAKPYFVPCSESVKKSYRDFFGMHESSSQVIYNSVNACLLSTTTGDLKRLSDELSLPRDAFIYISIGRLDAAKNHKILLEAFRKVLSEMPLTYLIIVGTGILENALKRQAEDLKIAENVVFLGRRNDVGALLQIADVFVFPSLLEGLPVALVEAMFKSLPCIASRIEVFEEVITHRKTGLLFDPNSSIQLAKAMLELQKNRPLRTLLGENAFPWAEAKFNVTVTARQWESLYDGIKFGSRKN